MGHGFGRRGPRHNFKQHGEQTHVGIDSQTSSTSSSTSTTSSTTTSTTTPPTSSTASPSTVTGSSTWLTPTPRSSITPTIVTPDGNQGYGKESPAKKKTTTSVVLMLLISSSNTESGPDNGNNISLYPGPALGYDPQLNSGLNVGYDSNSNPGLGAGYEIMNAVKDKANNVIPGFRQNTEHSRPADTDMAFLNPKGVDFPEISDPKIQNILNDINIDDAGVPNGFGTVYSSL